MRILFSIIIILSHKLTALCQPQNIVINNAKPRTDKKGEIVDAHDGRVIQFGQKFYWYGTRYGKTNGFTQANKYVCYSSDNLTNWQFEGALIADRPTGVYYRPHVVFNKKTKKYILWYNWNPKLWDGQFGVAESDKPQGPFKVVNDNVTVKNSAFGVGDLGVFIDDDEKAYLSYCTIKDHQVSVELLDDSYTKSTMQGSEIIAKHCEGGGLFKRKNLFYMMTDYTCCFCTQGSGAQVFTATNPLGPYTYRQNINRYEGSTVPFLNDNKINDNNFETLKLGQKNALEIAFSKSTLLSKTMIYQFTGNRNGQCGEVNNPVVHEPILSYDFNLSYWKDGVWQPITSPKTDRKTHAQQHIYTFSFPQITTDRIKIEPVYKDSASRLHISEIKFDMPSTNYSVYKTSNQGGKPIIPAQQTYVMEVKTSQGSQYIWMGDLWGSASDNIKGHDYQYWSPPLQFYANGLIKPLTWVDTWTLKMK
jgi:Glycosyl hydrolases family 43